MTSILAPTKGKPSAERSTTFGAKASLPANQGLTVWRSEEGTSMACGAISDRICADTTWLATSSRLRLFNAPKISALPSTAPTRNDAAREDQDLAENLGWRFGA